MNSFVVERPDADARSSVLPKGWSDASSGQQKRLPDIWECKRHHGMVYQVKRIARHVERSRESIFRRTYLIPAGLTLEISDGMTGM